MPLRCRALQRALFVSGTVLLTWPSASSGQDPVSVRVQENFRREPNGVLLARVDPGTDVTALDRQDGWTQVVLEGWVWLSSLGASEEPGFDLVVNADDGENLRDGPSGAVLGRFEEGALLTELERNDQWAHVSRIGWIWTASLDPAAASQAATSPGAGSEPVASAARSPQGFTNVGAGGGPILTAPDGDTLAMAAPASDLEIMRREGSWVRVRVEGWMWMPETQGVAAESDTASTEASTAVALAPEDVRLDPEAHAGRVVEWALQFISLERAEAVRTDFFEGEPFLLSRFGGGEGPYVYVAVATDRLAEVQGLVPLERVLVTGRIRTGASSLTGAPILDLISIESARESP